ncbi:dual specificity protein phosphatase [Trichuris trichiura]|uniref:Dual specificity protein phosphatase n=1 Tax=Trichuris trichiura TaxID=36087 RepID=A0A077ZA15_TRITR|nr:dual specificity protein phosphatase [Trichuris trichiura]
MISIGMPNASIGRKMLLPKEISANSLLILPTVSIGNASQQAVDLLICNMKIPFLCHLNADDCFLPMVASDPFDQNSPQVIIACSAYYCPDRNIIVLQFRSDCLGNHLEQVRLGYGIFYSSFLCEWLSSCAEPSELVLVVLLDPAESRPHRRHVFLKRLLGWIQEMSFRSVILLTSSWAGIRREPYLNSPGVFYLRADNATKTEEELNKLSLTKVPEEPELALPGSGFAVEFYNSIMVEIAKASMQCPNLTVYLFIFFFPTFSSLDIELFAIAAGSELPATNLQLLVQNRVTHIINAGTKVENYFPETFVYKRIVIQDLPTEDIKKYFEECNDFINQARRANGRCLVHCNAGISRSVSIVMAYLIKYEEMSVKSALYYVKAIRPVAQPNNGFLLQLLEYEEEVRGRL